MFTKSVVFAFLMILVGSVAQAEVLTFKTWKTSRVDEAKEAVETLKLSVDGVPKVTKKTLDRLEQAKLNLEIAEDLSISDYFVLYLVPLKSKDLMLEAARKMTPEEVAELMSAYQKSLSMADPPGVRPAVIGGAIPVSLHLSPRNVR